VTQVTVGVTKVTSASGEVTEKEGGIRDASPKPGACLKPKGQVTRLGSQPDVDVAPQVGTVNERVPQRGTKELSPVLQHWESEKRNLSAVGTAEKKSATNGVAAVPTGLGLFINDLPALKRWAKLFRAHGARSEPYRSRRLVPQVRPSVGLTWGHCTGHAQGRRLGSCHVVCWGWNRSGGQSW